MAQAVDPNGCVWGSPTVGMHQPPANFVPTWGSYQSLAMSDTAPSTPSSHHGQHKCASMVRHLLPFLMRSCNPPGSMPTVSYV